VIKSEFLLLIDDILEQPPGTLTGKELLKDLPNWDSLAFVSFIATVNARFDVTLAPAELKKCDSIASLLTIVGPPHVEG
jgi:acyl carrier protein